MLPRDFRLEHDEITPTLKLKRKVVLEHFAEERGALRWSPRGCGARRRTSRRTSLVEAGDLHDVARVRCVHELAAADVDADVAEAVEEDEVAGLQLVTARPGTP